MLRRSNSLRAAAGQVDFSEEVRQILYGGYDDLEEELIELMGGEETRESPDKTKDEELNEELAEIVKAFAPSSNSPTTRTRKPKLSESASQGTTDGSDMHTASGALEVHQTNVMTNSICAPDQVEVARAARIKRVTDMLNQRQQELRLAAYQARQVDEMDLAKQHARAARKVAAILKAVERGQAVDPKQLPPKPSLNTAFDGPVLSSVPCEPPALLRLDLEHAADRAERDKILISVLKSQIGEAMQLAQEQTRLKSMKAANELTGIANRAQSTVSMLAVQHKRALSLVPQFYSATLPIVNKNADMKDGIIEVTMAWGVKACALDPSEGSHLSATHILLQFPHPSESDSENRVTSKVPFTNRYSRGRSVQQLRVNTSNWFIRRMTSIRLHIFVCDVKDQKSRGRLLETITVPLRGLEQLATVNSVHLLENKCGVVEVTLRQRIPISGCYVTTTIKPWLCVTAVPVVSIKPVSSYPEAEASPSLKPVTNIVSKHDENCNVTTVHSSQSPRLPLKGITTETASVPHKSLPFQAKPSPQAERHLRIETSIPAPTVMTVSSSSVIGKSHRPETSESNGKVTVVQRALQQRPIPLTRSSSRAIPVRVESIQSRALLKSQERYHESRILDPGLTEAARQNHVNELKRARALLRVIDQRLAGPNAASEKKTYVAGLEQLLGHLEKLSQEARHSNNIPQWTGYQHKIIIVAEEIKSLK